jgi:hypothetical protein
MKTTKKALSLLLSLCLLLTAALCFTACGETEQPVTDPVYVTIASGDLKLAHHAVTLRDADEDGKTTINDALILAHDAAFEGGAAAGYASADTEYGKSITKLWGKDNGSGYGYYLNNAGAMSLNDEIKVGDSVQAFVYTTADFTDTFCYFDREAATVSKGDSLTLTLSAAGYDASWNPITVPVAGATILINGEDTGVKTNEQGQFTLTMGEKSKKDAFVISATSDSATLVPPVCLVTVE